MTLDPNNTKVKLIISLTIIILMLLSTYVAEVLL
jgi:hypothetical protein